MTLVIAEEAVEGTKNEEMIPVTDITGIGHPGIKTGKTEASSQKTQKKMGV